MEEYAQSDIFKDIYGVEIGKYLTPIMISIIAICGPPYSRFAILYGGYSKIVNKILSYSLIVLSCCVCLIFLLRFPGIIGISLTLIITFIAASVNYAPRSYVTIMIITLLMIFSGFTVDLLKDFFSLV